MTSPRSPIWLVAALALGACSSNVPPGEAPPPPSSTPDATLNAAPVPEPLIAAPAAPIAPVAPVAGGGGKLSDVSDERKQADTEACYRFARAQVANDIRIDNDISSARGDNFSQFSRITGLNRRVDSFFYEQQRSARFESCMRSKGYASQ